jgi:hypothetical protein
MGRPSSDASNGTRATIDGTWDREHTAGSGWLANFRRERDASRVSGKATQQHDWAGLKGQRIEGEELIWRAGEQESTTTAAGVLTQGRAL